jgi:hypothetical protein
MNIFMQIVEAIKNVSWSTILPAIASIWVAITATRALRTWKYQTRAQKHMEFMDELTDTVHEYIQAMEAPIQILEFVKIDIQAHSETESLQEKNIKNAGVITYIEKNGKADQIRLNEYLDKVRPIKSRMNSLAVKGQVLGFDNYKQCYDACTMLAWSHGQLEAFAVLIGSAHLNWQNQEIQQTLDKVMTVDAKTIKENLEKQNSVFLEFVKQIYQTLLT